MLVQYRFNVYFLPGFSAMHWLQIMATFQIFLNFRKSQIHAKKIILTNCLIIFKEKWSLKKLTRKSKFKVYGYITSLTTKSTWNQNFQVVFFRLVIFQLTTVYTETWLYSSVLALLSLGYTMTNDLPVCLFESILTIFFRMCVYFLQRAQWKNRNKNRKQLYLCSH